MDEPVNRGCVIEKLKFNLVGICHGKDVKEPYKQIQTYLATYS